MCHQRRGGGDGGGGGGEGAGGGGEGEGGGGGGGGLGEPFSHHRSVGMASLLLAAVAARRTRAANVLSVDGIGGFNSLMVAARFRISGTRVGSN
jgi:hypothetical protein